ncbi:formate dehydrogenase accessory sulfurtransferase FdhD [SAR202 cluster bacterium AC-409-J13_OGT_754m]|nr:formate dehydrogenase accessory sulfurtransferase FdhD [SAR202 cluster bacterium AC-409-J13_OGT_754m]
MRNEMFLGSTVKANITRIEGNIVTRHIDIITTEEPLEIRIYHSGLTGMEHTSVAVTMRTTLNDYELAAGFLYSEGLIKGREEIRRIAYCADDDVDQHYNIVNVYLKSDILFDSSQLTRNFYTSSSCGICGKASLEALELRDYVKPSSDRPTVIAGIINELPATLRKSQKVFNKTGGIHAAGLFNADGELLAAREDVGRHNALDKLIGWGLLAGKIPFHENILVVSGRVSYEIIQKALSAGIPIVVAVGAPSSLAVDLANNFDMTLIGFVKSDVFNIYSGETRIIKSK